MFTKIMNVFAEYRYVVGDKQANEELILFPIVTIMGVIALLGFVIIF